MAPSSWFENQPLSVLESMAAGKPVVASRLGGLVEIIRDGGTGILVPPDDPAALAAAIEGLWDDKARAAEMGVKAWDYAREEFAPDRQTGRLAELYRWLVASRGVRTGIGTHKLETRQPIGGT